MKNTKDNWILVALVTGLSLSRAGVTFAQDSESRDDAIFGESEPADLAKDRIPRGESDVSLSLFDKLDKSSQFTAGGEVQFNLGVSSQEGQDDLKNVGRSPVNSSPKAQIYFDGRPNDQVRSYLSLRLQENKVMDQSQQVVPSQSKEDSKSNALLRIDLEEAWIKWDSGRTIFFTAGRQKLKWGSARFWNPTDFLAREQKDPFATRDVRLGQDLFKVHVPFENSGTNLYAILDVTDVTRVDDAKLGLRAELPVGGSGELALTSVFKPASPRKWGLDFSTALGPVDLRFENALWEGAKVERVSGALDLQKGEFPKAQLASQRVYTQHALNIEKTLKYSDTDNATFGLEYFRNGLGYDNRVKQMVALVTGNRPFFGAGRDYLGAYLVLVQPGEWNNSTVTLNALRNMNDQTMSARAVYGHKILKDVTLEAGLGRCFGEAGELCFSVPRQIIDGYAALSQLKKGQKNVQSQGGIDGLPEIDVTKLPQKPQRWSATLALRLGF